MQPAPCSMQHDAARNLPTQAAQATSRGTTLAAMIIRYRSVTRRYAAAVPASPAAPTGSLVCTQRRSRALRGRRKQRLLNVYLHSVAKRLQPCRTSVFASCPPALTHAVYYEYPLVPSLAKAPGRGRWGPVARQQTAVLGGARTGTEAALGCAAGAAVGSAAGRAGAAGSASSDSPHIHRPHM
jgi:hypothetical protein